MLVDNTENNIGIMRAHNLGIDKMYADGADWLVILSAAVRFSKFGGMDFIDHLKNQHIVEGYGLYGWHLMAFHRKVFDRIGYWDTNFSPYGFDDIDLSLRIQRGFRKELVWHKPNVMAGDMGMGHSIKISGVVAPADPRIEYFIRKWGVHPGKANLKTSYKTPFNDPNNPLSYFPEGALDENPTSVPVV